jgi:hypothetical protein
MPNPSKLYRVKIVKQVYQGLEVLAPDGEKAVAAAEEQCAFFASEDRYFDGFQSVGMPRIIDPVEIVHPTGYECAQISWTGKGKHGENKLYRVKMVKTVAKDVEVTASSASAALAEAQKQCPPSEPWCPYGDGYRDDGPAKAIEAVEIAK